MASVNKQSLREEFDALKAEFERLSAAGKMAADSRALFQALLMLFALIAVPLMAISAQGGIDATLVTVKQTNPELLNAFTSSEGTGLTLIGVLAHGMGRVVSHYWSKC